MLDRLKIFSGSSNVVLAQQMCDLLHIPLGDASLKKFSDGEISVDICENVRGMDVFIVQSACTPANEYLMEMLIMLDALKRASPARITAVIPYYGYARQDRKVSSRAPISAKLRRSLLVRPSVPN